VPDAGGDAQAPDAMGIDGVLLSDVPRSDPPDPWDAEGQPDGIPDVKSSLDSAKADRTPDIRPPSIDADVDASPSNDTPATDDGNVGSSDTADDVPFVPPDATIDLWVPFDASDADQASYDTTVDGFSDADSGEDAPVSLDGVDANQEEVAPGDAEGDTQDATGEEATPLVCESDQTNCSNQCVDLKLDPNHCGDCTTVCETGICNDGTCFTCPVEVPKWCNGACINPDLDADNCGACGNACGTGICSNGQCEAAGTGRLVVIGHDYYVQRQNKNLFLGNAVFLRPVDPVRVLVYQGEANLTAVAGANAAIAQVRDSLRRSFTMIQGTASSVPTQLVNGEADVFLIYAQTGASDATLDQLGLDWANALHDFVYAGGRVVVLDADQAGNSGTVRILTSACQTPALCLLNISRQSPLPASTYCIVTAGGDALAAQAWKRYRCEDYSTTFTLGESGPTVTSVVEAVVGDAASAPVVISKVF
jgi:hypothetical protein